VLLQVPAGPRDKEERILSGAQLREEAPPRLSHHHLRLRPPHRPRLRPRQRLRRQGRVAAATGRRPRLHKQGRRERVRGGEEGPEGVLLRRLEELHRRHHQMVRRPIERSAGQGGQRCRPHQATGLVLYIFYVFFYY